MAKLDKQKFSMHNIDAIQFIAGLDDRNRVTIPKEVIELLKPLGKGDKITLQIKEVFRIVS